MPWLTPADLPDDFICMSLRLPNSPVLRQAIRGALLETTYETNWEQVGGGLLPDDVASVMSDAFGTLSQGCSLKPGDIVLYGGDTLPDNRLWCDGSTYSTDDYPLLFSAIGYAFGGSGGNFKVPDFKGRFAVGAGSGAGLTSRNLGDVGGGEDVTLSTNNLPSHDHTTHTHSTTPLNGGLEAPILVPTEIPGNTGLTGSGESFGIVPPFAAVNFTIVYQ